MNTTTLKDTVMSDTNWQCKEGDQFESRRILSLQIANAVKPRMVGGFISAPDIQACYTAAGHIEAQQQRIEALEGDNRTLILARNIDSVLIAKLERELAEASKDAARFWWVLPILTGDTDHTGDLRAIQLGFELARGSSGADAIDAAMKGQQ